MATITETAELLRDLDEDDREQRLLLCNVSRDAYLAIGRALRDRAALHMTYDRGTLELTTTSDARELYKALFLLLIGVWAEELNIPMRCLGSKTHRRKDIKRGAEPDQCFYVRNLDKIRGQQQINLLRDPPPDVVLEIEVSRSAINKLQLYAAFGVPEVWRFDGERLRMAVLSRGRSYREITESTVFTGLAADELARYVRLGGAQDDTALLRKFRRWVRDQMKKNGT